LRSKRYDDEAIDGAIDKLRAQRYVNDLDFAKYWIEQRSRFRPKGDLALVSELTNRGVARETIDAALGDMPAESEGERARRAIARQLIRWTSLAPAERKRKIHAFLAQRGFGYDAIEEVIARPEAEGAEETAAEPQQLGDVSLAGNRGGERDYVDRQPQERSAARPAAPRASGPRRK
jgi:regulatory protein